MFGFKKLKKTVESLERRITSEKGSSLGNHYSILKNKSRIDHLEDFTKILVMTHPITKEISRKCSNCEHQVFSMPYTFGENKVTRCRVLKKTVNPCDSCDAFTLSLTQVKKVLKHKFREESMGYVEGPVSEQDE